MVFSTKQANKTKSIYSDEYCDWKHPQCSGSGKWQKPTSVPWTSNALQRVQKLTSVPWTSNPWQRAHLFNIHQRLEPPASWLCAIWSALWILALLEALVAAGLFGWAHRRAALIHQHAIQALRVGTARVFLIRFTLAARDLGQVCLVHLHVAHWHIDLKDKGQTYRNAIWKSALCLGQKYPYHSPPPHKSAYFTLCFQVNPFNFTLCF